jgi:hypothetical protein
MAGELSFFMGGSSSVALGALVDETGNLAVAEAGGLEVHPAQD